MSRYFSKAVTDSHITISGDDAKHIIKVLRKKVGDKITVCDTVGFDYECEIELLSDEVLLKVLEKSPNLTEPTCFVTLYQALPKSDKMEFIIQKAVELGVSRIVPVSSEFCVAKIDKTSQAKKLERFNKIAVSAAEQSGRGIIPQVTEVVTFTKAIEQMSLSESAILFYENATTHIKNEVSPEKKSVAFMIGSEGGFSVTEVEFAKKNNVKIISLGSRILRCETAPIVGATLIMNLTGNM
ncbi:MAG: RsmE family RNA methyltransferase [Oscillospiraceae bacterium]